MYAVYCAEHTIAARILSILGEEADLRATLPAFRRAFLRLSAGILACPCLAEELRPFLSGLRGRSVESSLFLVTRLTRRNCELLASLTPVRRVIWLDEIESKLREALDLRTRTGALTDLEAELVRLAADGWLQDALVIAARSEPPPSSVRAWARLIPCAVSTLEYHWRRDFPNGIGGLRPKDFLDRLILLSACEALKRTKPEAVAYRLHCHRRTLERLAARTGYPSLCALRREPSSTVIERILADFGVVTPL